MISEISPDSRRVGLISQADRFDFADTIHLSLGGRALSNEVLPRTDTDAGANEDDIPEDNE